MIYLDNSATTKPYKEVLDSFTTVSMDYFGNPSSLHHLGGQAEKLLIQAREQVAHLLKVKASEVYFTSGGTESNNLAIKGSALMNRNRGRHIISTNVEHPSVESALEQLKEFGFEITYLPVDKNGRIRPNDLERTIRKDTILVSIIQVNNEVGTVQPIEEIGSILKKYPSILFHVDAVQGIGKVPLSLSHNRIDLCSISGHKLHALKGTGALFIREGVRLAPLFSGGNQEQTVRSGTENVAGIVAMAKALRMTLAKSVTGVQNMKEVQSIFRKELAKINGLLIHTPIHHSAPHIINFSVEGIKSEVLIHALEQKDIFVSTTSACSSKKRMPSKTLLAMGFPNKIAESAIRISLNYDNTVEEANNAVLEISTAVNHLRKVMKS